MLKLIKTTICLMVVMIATSSCSKKVVDIKSPCASNDGGPCGPRKPVNDWWLKNNKNSNS